MRHYSVLFEVSCRIADIFKGEGNCVNSVKTKFTFSNYVKKFGASLKASVLFRLSTRVLTLNYVGNFFDQVDLDVVYKFFFVWRCEFCHQEESHFDGVAVRQ